MHNDVLHIQTCLKRGEPTVLLGSCCCRGQLSWAVSHVTDAAENRVLGVWSSVSPESSLWRESRDGDSMQALCCIAFGFQKLWTCLGSNPNATKLHISDLAASYGAVWVLLPMISQSCQPSRNERETHANDPLLTLSRHTSYFSRRHITSRHKVENCVNTSVTETSTSAAIWATKGLKYCIWFWSNA